MVVDLHVLVVELQSVAVPDLFKLNESHFINNSHIITQVMMKTSDNT